MILTATEVLTAYVTKLRAIAELVTAVQGADRIVQHSYTKPLRQAIANLTIPGILVAWIGYGRGMRGSIRQIGHQIRLFVRVQGDPSMILNLITDGVPAGGDGQPMIRTDIHPLLYPMEDPSPELHEFDLGDGAVLEYWRVAIQFTQRRN